MSLFVLRASGASRGHRRAAALVLAGGLQAGAVLADGRGEGPVTWGSEQGGGYSTLGVPFTTPDRERIEVVAAFQYMDQRLLAHENMMREWRTSLPDTVDLLRVPLVWKRGEEDRRSWMHRRNHREALLAARMLGIEDRVHSALVRALNEAPYSLGTEGRVRRFLAGHGIVDSAYEEAVRSPALRGMWWEGSALSAAMQNAETEELPGVPWLLVNGRYVTSSRRAGSAAAAFRVANRLIRESLDSGTPFHRGPTDIPELIGTLGQWPGEHLSNVQSGRFRGVYNPWRRELWSLDEAGEVRSVAREVEGERAFWKWLDRDSKRTSYAMNWRAGFYYAPREPRVRHGAFLLADWLSGGQVVELTFGRRPVGLSFAPEGRVEARSEEGAVRGSWWLEAAALHVSLGEYGIASWPWREASRQVGFEVPPGSFTPWRTMRAESAPRHPSLAHRLAGGD